MPFFGPPNLQKLKENRDINGLNSALKNKDINIVREAAFVLAELGQYTPVLIIGLTSSDWKIRQKTYGYYAGFKHLGFIPLLASLHDENEMVRISGLTYLLFRQEVRALNAIGNCLLRDPSKHVRKAAIIALSKFGNSDTIDYLIAARNDSDDEVRSMVNEALEKLGY